MAEPDDEVRLALLKDSIQRIEKDAAEFEGRLEKKFNEYVLKIAFEAQKDRLDDRIKPLERLVYGMVGLILIAVVTALIATVVVS
jgi:hypothetical protein